MPQAKKKKPERPGMFELLAADLAKKGEDKTVVRESVPPVTIPKPVAPSGDVLLAREYPYLGDSIPGLLKAILKEMLLMRYSHGQQ